MDRLRSEDLKEEKVVTAPTIIVAGRQGGSTSRVGAIPSVREEVHSLRICCLCRGSELDFLEPWLMQPRAAVTIPLYNRVILVRPFDRTVFSSQPSKISQTLDPIAGIQFRLLRGGIDQRWPSGSVCVRRCSSARQGRLLSLAQFGCRLLQTAHIHPPGGSASPAHLLFIERTSLPGCYVGPDPCADPNCSVLKPPSGLDRQIDRRGRGNGSVVSWAEGHREEADVNREEQGSEVNCEPAMHHHRDSQ